MPRKKKPAVAETAKRSYKRASAKRASASSGSTVGFDTVVSENHSVIEAIRDSWSTLEKIAQRELSRLG